MQGSGNLAVKLICVLAVAAVMLPVGSYAMPYLPDAIEGTPFHALEAMVTATLGLSLYSMLAG